MDENIIPELRSKLNNALKEIERLKEHIRFIKEIRVNVLTNRTRDMIEKAIKDES